MNPPQAHPPSIADGHYSNPHGLPRFFARGGRLYWETGEVTGPEKSPGVIISSQGEDYSAWSDDHRALVYAAFLDDKKEREAFSEQYRIRLEALRASARAKLTPEEIEACDL